MPSAATPNAFIPAWKRLGLKLKSEQATPEATIDSPGVEPESPKRKRVLEGTEINIPSKKAKNHPPSTVHEPITPRLERKKSVTFTPETKAEDGDSIKQLFNSWVAEQKLQDPSFEFHNSNPSFQIPEPPQVEEFVDTTLNEKERRLKRVKKPKQEKTNTSIKPLKIKKPATAPSRPFLQYLRQYCESKDTWKFNKNHQNHLIRSIFSIEAIPSDHAHFIYQYVRGLQGGVRDRLRDTAFAVKVKDLEDGPAGFPANMPEPERRQQEYDAALKKFLETMIASSSSVEMGYEEGILHGLSNENMKGRAAKRMRSEQILHDLGSAQNNSRVAEVNGDDDNQKKLRMNDGSSQKIARKRKQRTAVVEESSSSDESSDSDSDSDSESDSEGSSDGSPSENEGADDTSSSSSSSSGSESESDSSEGSSEESDDSDSD